VRENPPGGLTCRSVNNKRYIDIRKIFVIGLFHQFAEKPPMDGRICTKFCIGGSSRGRNHLFQILCRSVAGFQISSGSNFAILDHLAGRH